MWKCMDCNIIFEFPEIKRPDAGPVSGIDILGLRKVKAIKFCHDCLSTRIERSNEKA